MMTLEFEKATTALACWRAAGTELYRGMIAVGMVLRNRATAGMFEGDIYKNAIMELNDALGDNNDYPDPRDQQFQTLLRGMDALFDYTLVDKTGDALWYAKLHDDHPIAFERTAHIGNLIFGKN